MRGEERQNQNRENPQSILKRISLPAERIGRRRHKRGWRGGGRGKDPFNQFKGVESASINSLKEKKKILMEFC